MIIVILTSFGFTAISMSLYLFFLHIFILSIHMVSWHRNVMEIFFFFCLLFYSQQLNETQEKKKNKTHTSRYDEQQIKKKAWTKKNAIRESFRKWIKVSIGLISKRWQEKGWAIAIDRIFLFILLFRLGLS